MTCADIKDRTIDHLYGELPEGDRAAFDQHLAGCQSCRAEVAALQGTLHQARAAVKLTDEAPPARVHLAVMEAARAAAATAGLAARAAAPRPQQKAQAVQGGSFWSWLRGPWLMPLAGATALMAIFVLAREVILKPSAPLPSRVSEEPPAPVVSAPREAPAPKMADERVLAPLPSEPAPAAERKPAPRPAPRGLDGMLGGGRSERRPVANKGPREAPADSRFAPPPPARKRVLDMEEAGALEGLEGSAAGGVAARDDVRATQKERSQDKQEALRAGAGAGSLDGLARGERAAAAAEKKQARPSTSREELAKVAPARPQAPASAPAAAPPPPPSPAPVRSRRSMEPVAEPAAVAASAPAEAEADAPVSRAKAKKDALSPFDQQVEKANRLFTAQRWAEAATAYRELLRQYPQHQSAKGWKGRLQACEQALSQ